MYHSVVFGLNDQGNDHSSYNKRLLDHFPILATFVVKSCSLNVHPTIVNAI
jgi:hypothetical protein